MIAVGCVWLLIILAKGAYDCLEILNIRIEHVRAHQDPSQGSILFLDFSFLKQELRNKIALSWCWYFLTPSTCKSM